jgi:hypothetical protein
MLKLWAILMNKNGPSSDKNLLTSPFIQSFFPQATARPSALI